VLQDLGLPPYAEDVKEGFATLQEMLTAAPNTKVIVITGRDEHAHAVRAVGLGAYDFYQKPVDIDVLRLIVERAFHVWELEEEHRALQRHLGTAPLDGVIATSDAMLKVCRMVEKIAPTSATALLLGESGTGKELLARALHDLSTRRTGPFVPINCAAIPDALLESELFGYEKGAFTGAAKQTPGKIEGANGGTLFLDEIGDMPATLQAKLLRFLQERVVERVGGREQLAVDVRVVCATNRDLNASIAAGQFRPDLFYRVSEVTIDIPPLRQRAGDSLVIAQYLLERRARQHGRALRGFSADAVRAIRDYAWPGNIRELDNKVNRAVILAEGNQVRASDLGFEDPGADTSVVNLRQARQQAERQAIRQALAITGGNVSRAAELLGITRPTLYDLLEKSGITVDTDRPVSP